MMTFLYYVAAFPNCDISPKRRHPRHRPLNLSSNHCRTLFQRLKAEETPYRLLKRHILYRRKTAIEVHPELSLCFVT